MNFAGATGFLIKHGERACTPQGVEKLLFDVLIYTGSGQRIPWHCEVDQKELLDKYQPLLTPGRSIILQAELDGREFRERGVHKGWVRFLRVTKAEFPDRSKQEEVKETAEATG